MDLGRRIQIHVVLGSCNYCFSKENVQMLLLPQLEQGLTQREPVGGYDDTEHVPPCIKDVMC